jgi:hypothetical protein
MRDYDFKSVFMSIDRSFATITLFEVGVDKNMLKSIGAIKCMYISYFHVIVCLWSSILKSPFGIVKFYNNQFWAMNTSELWSKYWKKHKCIYYADLIEIQVRCHYCTRLKEGWMAHKIRNAIELQLHLLCDQQYSIQPMISLNVS